MMCDKIKELRESTGMSARKFAEEIGLKYTTYYGYERGTREPGADFIAAIASYFGVSVDYLLGLEDKKWPSNLSPLPKMKKIPLVGTIACGQPILAEENITDYIDLPGHIRADFALTCRGDSMINAGINDGDIVYIRKQETVENGQIAAVLVEDGNMEATLKRFYFSGNTVMLNAENPAYDPLVYVGAEIENVHVIGLAVAFTHIIK